MYPVIMKVFLWATIAIAGVVEGMVQVSRRSSKVYLWQECCRCERIFFTRTPFRLNEYSVILNVIMDRITREQICSCPHTTVTPCYSATKRRVFKLLIELTCTHCRLTTLHDWRHLPLYLLRRAQHLSVCFNKKVTAKPSVPTLLDTRHLICMNWVFQIVAARIWKRSSAASGMPMIYQHLSTWIVEIMSFVSLLLK